MTSSRASPRDRDRTATLADGRRISWAEYGSPSGAPLLLLHGSPDSRLQLATAHAPAEAAGIRVVAPDRPGYGLSDPKPGGTGYSEYGDDLRQLLDHLDVSTVTLCALSGAGGFAVATAVTQADRVDRLLLVSAGLPAPRSATRGQALPVRLLLLLAARASGVAARVLARPGFDDLDSPVGRLALRMFPAADRRVLADQDLRAHLAEDAREAARQGPAAAVQDLRLGSGPLGVSLGDLRVDTVLLHGTDDVNVPVGIARWVAAQAPSSRLVEVPGAAHLFALERPEWILEGVVRSG
ncbi:alpha/beta fold hydrolase [Blastococcus sp. SYSU D00669]